MVAPQQDQCKTIQVLATESCPEQFLPKLTWDHFQVPFWLQEALTLKHAPEKTKPLSQQLWLPTSSSKFFQYPLGSSIPKAHLPLYIWKERGWNVNGFVQGAWCPSVPGHSENFIFYIREFHTFGVLHYLELHWTAPFINEVYVLSTLLSTVFNIPINPLRKALLTPFCR